MRRDLTIEALTSGLALRAPTNQTTDANPSLEVGSREVLASGTLVPEPSPFGQRIGEAAIAAREGGGFMVVYARVEPESGMVRRLWSRALEYPTRRRPVAR